MYMLSTNSRRANEDCLLVKKLDVVSERSSVSYKKKARKV
jgi:hypothetical protein